MNFSFPGCIEPTLALVPRAKPRPAAARVRDGLDCLPPLHSLPHSAAQISRDALAHSDVSKSFETVKVSADAPPKKFKARPRRFAPRAARTVTAFPVLADRARAQPHMKTRKWPRDYVRPSTGISPRASHGQDISNSRITGQPSVAPQAALGNCPALLENPS